MAHRTHWALAALVALSGTFAVDALHAQQAAPKSASPFEPIEAPTLSPDAFKPPPPAPNVDATNFDKLSKEPPGVKLPNRIDIGKFELQFNSGRTRDITTREGLDSGETSNLSATLPAQKQNQPLPDYFGLKLTAPTR